MVAVGSGLNSNTTISTTAQSSAERPTIETISSETGVLYTIGKGDETVYMIECDHKPLKLHILNMPDGFSGDIPVKVSGRIKATHPLEDEWGNYFELTSILPQ